MYGVAFATTPERKHMNMKVLNLDGFAQVKRQLSLNGKSHNVLETSVQQFIDNLAAAEALEAKGEKTPETLSRQVQASVDAILQSVPSMAREELVALSIDALSTILKFIRGEIDPEVTPAAATEQAGGADEKKD